MKYLLILLFSPFIARAQQSGSGLWIKVKEELKNGSSVFLTAKNFVKYRLSSDGAAHLGTDPLFYTLETKYTVSDSILIIGRVNYKVDKWTVDSLIIHENDASLDLATFRKYYFIFSGSQVLKQKPVYNVDIKDSVYTSNRYLFPEYDGSSSDLITRFENNISKGDIHISFIINKNGKLTDLKVIENNNIQKNVETSVVKAFQSTHNDWIPAIINGQNVNASMDVILHFGIMFSNTGRNLGISFEYPFIGSE